MGSATQGPRHTGARGRASRTTEVEQPAVLRMVRRALVLRCPWCGARRTFLRGWFRRHDRCRTCGIRWRREEGFELGALALNTVLTFGALAVAMIIGFVATAPDIPVLPFVLSLAAVAVLMPIVIYPFTYTLWLAIDLRVHPPDAAELSSATASVGGPPSAGA
jgi:uncharacterized protein (DUF983 family)